MKTGKRHVPSVTAGPRTQVFVALEHALAVTCIADGCWSVSVDGVTYQGTFGSQAEAWEAGVRAADLRDRWRQAQVR